MRMMAIFLVSDETFFENSKNSKSERWHFKRWRCDRHTWESSDEFKWMVRCFVLIEKSPCKNSYDTNQTSPRSVPNTLSKFREDCPAFVGKTPFQDRVLRALNLPSKLVEESDEKENNEKRSVCASPPKPTKRKVEGERNFRFNHKSTALSTIWRKKERSRKLKRWWNLKGWVEEFSEDIASLKTKLDS